LAAGLRPDPVGSLQRSPDPLAGFRGRRTPGKGVGNWRERSARERRKRRRWKGFHTGTSFSQFRPA